MTDTPTIALYYREHDPMKRKMFLDQSIAAGEDEEANAVRKELWELRYGEPSEAGSGTRADGYLALWMAMEYNKDMFRHGTQDRHARSADHAGRNDDPALRVSANNTSLELSLSINVKRNVRCVKS